MPAQTIYIPYTYLIGWSSLNTWYYGVRFAKSSNCLYSSGCHPDELWKTYFTSSKAVEEFRSENGDPDIIQVRKTFNSSAAAKRFETGVLRKTSAKKDARFLNACDNTAIPSHEDLHPLVQRRKARGTSVNGKKTKSDPAWKATKGKSQREKVSIHNKQKMSRPIVLEIKKLLKHFGLKLHKGWPNHSDKKLTSILEDLKVQTKTMKKFEKVYSEKSLRRLKTIENLKSRKIVEEIKEIQDVVGCKIGTGWWQKSDSELAELKKRLEKQISC